MNTNRKIAVAIMVLSVILAAWLYGTEYYTSSNPDKIEDTLTAYISGDDIRTGTGSSPQLFVFHDLKAEVVQTKKIGNSMIVLFTDGKLDNFLGLARFKRGLNFKWRPIAANYGPGVGGSRDFSFTIGKKRYVAICGVNIDPRVVYYEYVTTDANPVVLHSNTVSEPSFMDIYEFETGYWPTLRLIDSSGNDIAPELHKLHDQSAPSAGVGTAELFMINVFCGLILFVGYIIARYYWTSEPQSKEEKKDICI